MLTYDQVKERLEDLVDKGRNIQAEVGGPDPDYKEDAEKDASDAVNALLKDLGFNKPSGKAKA